MPEFPISLPNPKPNEITWQAQNAVATANFPFSGRQQVYAHPAQWWEIAIELPPLKPSQADLWLTALLSLNGREGTFNLQPSEFTPPTGITGTATIQELGPDLNTLTYDGTTALIPPAAWIQINTSLHRVTASSPGIEPEPNILEIWPFPRADIITGTSTINYLDPHGTFRLKNPSEWNLDLAKFTGITLSAREALPPLD